MVRALILGLPVLLGMAPAGYGQVAYTFTSYDGRPVFSANGINNRGQVTGYYNLNSDPPLPYRGFVVTESGFTSFSVSPNGTFAYGINDIGQIVGTNSVVDFHSRGFLGSAAGSITSLNVPGATDTAALGINSSGQIVGEYSSNANDRGFLRDASGGYMTFEFPGATQTSASGISTIGEIVGCYTDGATYHGFLRSEVGQYSAIDVPGATETFAVGMNNVGDIVGSYDSHGFLLSGGVFYTIDFPGAISTGVNGINDLGQLVGTYSLEHCSANGFVATPVPEPTTLILTAAASIIALGFARTRKRRIAGTLPHSL